MHRNKYIKLLSKLFFHHINYSAGPNVKELEVE